MFAICSIVSFTGMLVNSWMASKLVRYVLGMPLKSVLVIFSAAVKLSLIQKDEGRKGESKDKSH